MAEDACDGRAASHESRSARRAAAPAIPITIASSTMTNMGSRDPFAADRGASGGSSTAGELGGAVTAGDSSGAAAVGAGDSDRDRSSTSSLGISAGRDASGIRASASSSRSGLLCVATSRENTLSAARSMRVGSQTARRFVAKRLPPRYVPRGDPRSRTTTRSPSHSTEKCSRDASSASRKRSQLFPRPTR